MPSEYANVRRVQVNVVEVDFSADCQKLFDYNEIQPSFDGTLFVLEVLLGVQSLLIKL